MWSPIQYINAATAIASATMTSPDGRSSGTGEAATDGLAAAARSSARRATARRGGAARDVPPRTQRPAGCSAVSL